MQRRSAFVRRHERGQTIILVAISIVSLLAMAALAIDVVTLYSASSETQRAADAAALAGAKALADSGITTLSTGDLALDTPQIQTLAINMATSAISATLPANVVAGSAPTVVGSPAFNFSTSQTTPAINNPTVTVTLQRTGLPTFFAHIWGRTAATVSASATAEAYNPANLASFTPITPKCVKPWLVANADP
ncbi:MAG TPA: pilus assembly protein TadG-related protein, partial [Terriglobales bacterium]|nr:pilus assembly protein TadG-related protein [Terriglobales bacterium]